MGPVIPKGSQAMIDTPKAKLSQRQSQRLLQTVLAKPWLYTRKGRYYLRLRPRKATTDHFTLSLRTTDRTIAMLTTQDIMKALKVFHLDNPDIKWPALKERLHDVAGECLSMAHGDDSLYAYSVIYGELAQALAQASATVPLNIDQQRGAAIAKDTMDGAQERLIGNPKPLINIMQALEESDAPTSLSVSSSVSVPQEPLAWDEMARLYLKEHGGNVKPTTLSNLEHNYRVIGTTFEVIGVSDMKTHTRADMIALRTELLTTRKPSTVNNLITQMSTVLDWAVKNDHITKAYTSKLKLTKGTDSEREAFTRDQVVKLIGHANSMPLDSWQRWGLSLLAITGARVGEVAQLTKLDLKEVDGLTCIHINEDSPDKSIKNKFSARLVPLVDGALGFNLKEFLEGVERGALPSTQGISGIQVRKLLGKLMRDILGEDRAASQTLHSLRHHMASSMKAHGVPVAYAQAILGHASGTITYDDYGSEIPPLALAEVIERLLVTR